MAENQQNCFRLAPDSGLETLTDHPDAPYRLSPEHSIVIEHTYFDSFDWRLYRQDWRLYYQHGQQQGFDPQVFVLSTAKRTLKTDCASLIDQWLPAPELPEAIAREITATLKPRALLPIATARIHRTSVDCLNTDDKTVARLQIDRIETRNDKHKPWRMLETRCRLLPLRGYEKPSSRLRDFLSDSGRCIPCRDDLLPGCLDQLGIEPCRYSSRPRLKLNPELRSDEAMKVVLASLHDIMTANLGGILADIDSEFLHDFRTAIRRARTALDQIRFVFPARRTQRLSGNLAWLGSATTLLRDLDVHLLDFPVYRQRLPDHLRSAFNPLGKLLNARRMAELVRLQHTLRGQRFQRFMNDWQAFLETPNPAPAKTILRNACRPIHVTSGKRIHKIYDQICAEGLEIDQESPPEALHKLRKHCKKLRYLLELFESCLSYPGPIRVIRSLKSLQDLLGGYQDCHVQAAALAAFKYDLATTDPSSCAAIDSLLGDLNKQQARLREAFHDTIRAFACAENQSLIQKLTKPFY